MITLRIKDGEETLIRMMGVYVTVRRRNAQESEISLRYHPDTKAAIPATTVERPEKRLYNASNSRTNGTRSIEDRQ
jgi:hypothetical protein